MAATRAPEEEPGVGAVVGLASALHRQTRDTAALIAADARLAGVSLAAIINGLILSGLCVLIAWGLLVAMAVWWLTSGGWPLGPILGALALIHVVIGYVLWKKTISLARHLEFRATRRQLRLSDEGSGG